MTLLGSNSATAPKRLFEPADFQRTFLILWAIFVLFYFSELAGFSLSIDEEKALMRTDPGLWVAQDRWLIYLIELFVLPPPVLPFFPLFVFGALASLGYIAVAKCHDFDLADWRVLLLFVLFSAFPALFFILDFSMTTPSCGVALLLACLSLFLFDRVMDAMAEPGHGRRRLMGLFALQALLGAGVIGVYQSLILLVAVGCCGIFLIRALRGPALPLRHILLLHAYLLAMLVAGVLLSYLIAYGLQWLIGHHAGYTGRFVRPDRLVESPWNVIQKILREYWAVYGGKRAVYGFRYVTFPLLLVLGMVALGARAWQRGRLAVLLVILYMLGMTLIPFAIHPLSGGKLPYRTLVSVPYVFWFFAAAAALSHVAWIRRAGIVLVIIVALQSLYTFSSFQAQKRLVLDHDRQLASQIYQRVVAEIPDFNRKQVYRIDFYGDHEFRIPYREVGGSTWPASFFEWDNGSPSRIVDFMTILGYSNFKNLDDATRAALLPVTEKMPIWPAAGSVQVVDGVILVRLGARPGIAHLQATEEP
ncbi:MAG TPA: glucosyltransferase domain-containing protein [Dongiaceae bacterium]|nr:glucosyltransferase domain-containing protein [Dongiaceae bacterium]